MVLLFIGPLLAGGCSPDPLSEQQPSDVVPRARASTETAAPGPLVFLERASHTGLEFTHFNGMTGSYFLPEIIGAGAAFLDADRDGDLDVFLVQGRSLEPANLPADALNKPKAQVQDRLFRNELVETGRLRFVDITEQAGLQSDGYGMGVAVADYDGDGWSDIYVTNLGSNQLWRNRGDGTFEDVTHSAGADDPRWSVPAVFFDYDGDEALDLFIGNYVDFNQGTHTVCLTGSGVPDYCSPKSFRSEPDRLLRTVSMMEIWVSRAFFSSAVPPWESTLESPQSTTNARLNFRLPEELKATIEKAAAQLGQSVSDFAVSTLVRTAREVIRKHDVTELSDRDRDVFVSILDDSDARPNEALASAAERYKKEMG